MATTSRRDELSDRQRSVLEYIIEFVDEHSYPPSVREIGEAVGLSSPSSVHAQLVTLEAKGYLRRDPTRPRAMEFNRDPDTNLEMRATSTVNLPLLGEIAAGGPIVAEEGVDALYTLPRDLVGEGDLFLLKVRGDSMIEAGVFDGDLVAVRQQPTVEQGEMCAALVEGEATVKFFRRTKGGAVFLDPANENYDPIPVDPKADGNAIMGRVVTVLRRL